MENDRVDESSDESSDEEDVQTQGFEADQLDAHLEKNEVFQQWLDTARDASRQARTERFEKYLAQGMEEADAKEKAHWKTTPEIKLEFFDNYETHLWEYKTLEFNHVHRDILHTMDKRFDRWGEYPPRHKESGGQTQARIRRLVSRTGRRFGRGPWRGGSRSQRRRGGLKESMREIFKEPIKNSH